MISFKRANGSTATIVFRHHGRRPKKAPSATTCYIYQGDTKANRMLIADAMTRPCKDYPKIVANDGDLNKARAKYGSRILREMRLPEGGYVLLIRGDNFSYEEGRKVALTKALDTLHKDERRAAWAAYHERNLGPDEDEDTVEDLIKLEA